MRDVEKVNGSLKAINERFLKQEADKKIMERVRNDISSIMTRMVSLEKATASNNKNSASQSTMNSEMISQALGRIKVLEERDKAARELHPITRILLDRKHLWREMGFESNGKLEKFANDVTFPSPHPRPHITAREKEGRLT